MNKDKKLNQTTKKSTKNREKFESRLKIINYLYELILLQQPITSEAAFEKGAFTEFELKVIDKIGENYAKLVQTIEKYLSETWKWNRLDPLEQAILVYGAFELQFNDLALVVNEMVLIARGLIPGEAYKYINSVLDRIGKEYQAIKQG